MSTDQRFRNNPHAVAHAEALRCLLADPSNKELQRAEYTAYAKYIANPEPEWGSQPYKAS